MNTLKTNNDQSTHYMPLSENTQTNRRLSSSILDEKASLNDSTHHRRSFGESCKENHPLTPKSRVNINFDILCKNEIDSMHQINARRKVFL